MHWFDLLLVWKKIVILQNFKKKEKKTTFWIHHKIGKKYIDVNIKSQEAKDLNKSIILFYFIFLKQMEKFIAKKDTIKKRQKH